jgi:general secretion pathway protein C
VARLLLQMGGMDALLRRWSWLVEVGVVALCLVFVARGLSIALAGVGPQLPWVARTVAHPPVVCRAEGEGLSAAAVILRTGETSYEIPRGTLEATLGNANLLSRSARIVPEVRDGKGAGLRLYRVRPEGPLGVVGMQNGDVITSINGLELTSPEQALAAYAQLRAASHLSVGLERNGRKVTLDYAIR